MSDLDTVIVTFQTQLSDVMEAVVKTAMFEVTRLVEDVVLVEVKRRNQEVESLRMQLKWTKSKFSDQGSKEGGKTGKCVDCARDDVELSADTVEERPVEQQGDMLKSCGVKKEGDSVERWITSSRQEVISESPQEASNPSNTQSPERQSQAIEEEDAMPTLDMKEEEVNNPSCSSMIFGGWSGTLDDEEVPKSDSPAEMVEAQPKETQKNEELLRTVIKQDPQISYGFCEDQQKSHIPTDQPHVLSLEMDTSWTGLTVKPAGLLQNHRVGAEKERDSVKTKGSLKRTEHELSDSVRADVQVTPGRDQISTSGSPKARLQHSATLGVTIKEEVIIDSDGCEESEHVGKKVTKSGMASLSCSVKQHRVSSQPHKPNHIYHKATVQEVMKLHSKVSTGVRLQAAIQHLHRPMKKPSHTLLNSTNAALSVAHSQVVNLNNLNRIPSTSKAAPPPASSVQRVHLGDKQTSALNRPGAPWVSIKSQHQSANSHHANPTPHPDSHPHVGPRHLLRCGQCGKCFPHPSNLKAHLQTHTGERPFCCSLCGRSFTKLSNLKAHRRVHTGERPYCCLACGKRFTQKCNLKRHQRIHLDV
ncbi:zinc finger protein 37 homolog [Acanthochromis polyacanthus]|uniref:zinc finger protein 37 homolog n=1 Tax=Acanthochromis polyacanthus TaxID=80966 RepID=UPI0022348EE0|nr:zinc finger protein 37 homolog [Acanthochromis polyacanthus]